jgi:hypothetical protein
MERVKLRRAHPSQLHLNQCAKLELFMLKFNSKPKNPWAAIYLVVAMVDIVERQQGAANFFCDS